MDETGCGYFKVVSAADHVADGEKDSPPPLARGMERLRIPGTAEQIAAAERAIDRIIQVSCVSGYCSFVIHCARLFWSSFSAFWLV